MPRLRVQYPGALDHVLARGNARQDIVSDDHDRQRLLEHLDAATVGNGSRAGSRRTPSSESR